MEAVLLSNKRTASTFLQEALDSHPDISAFDEMFMVATKLTERRGCKLYKTMKEQKGFNVPQYLDWISKKDKNTIFRLIYNQAESWGVLPHIKKRNMKIIHLLRDPVDIVVSLFCKHSNINPKDTVYIDPQQFQSMLGEHIKRRNKYMKRLRDYKDILILDYNDLFGRVQGERRNINLVGSFNIRSDQITYLDEYTNKEICSFLEVDDIPMYSTITKKFTLPREKKISNWRELERFM